MRSIAKAQHAFSILLAAGLVVLLTNGPATAQVGGGGGNAVITGVVQEWVRDRPSDSVPRAKPLENATVLVAFMMNATFNARYTIEVKNDLGCPRCGGRVWRARTDSEGRFRVSVPSGGRMDIHITKRGYVPKNFRSVSMDVGGVDLGVIDLGRVMTPGQGGLVHHQDPTVVRKQLARDDPPCCSNYAVPSRGIGDRRDPVAGDVSGEPSGQPSGVPSGQPSGVPSGVPSGTPSPGGPSPSGALNAAIDAREEAIKKIDEGLAKLNAMDDRPDTEPRREALREAFLQRRRSHSDAIVTLRSKLDQAEPPAVAEPEAPAVPEPEPPMVAEPEPPAVAETPPKPGAPKPKATKPSVPPRKPQAPRTMICPRCNREGPYASNTPLCNPCTPPVMSDYGTYYYTRGKSGGKDKAFHNMLPPGTRKQIEENQDRVRKQFERAGPHKGGVAPPSGERIRVPPRSGAR